MLYVALVTQGSVETQSAGGQAVPS